MSYPNLAKHLTRAFKKRDLAADAAALDLTVDELQKIIDGEVHLSTADAVKLATLLDENVSHILTQQTTDELAALDYTPPKAVATSKSPIAPHRRTPIAEGFGTL